MKAVVFDQQTRFDPDYPTPAAGRDEVCINVHLAGVCATDLHIIQGYMNFSGVLGHEFVGHVTDGPKHLLDKRVVAEINCVCGTCDLCQSGLSSHCRNRTVIGIDGHDGAMAQYVTAPVRNVHELPDSISDEEAVFVEPLAAACQVLMQVPVESRTRVAVIGAGRLGILVAQVLATTGCRLTVVSRSQHKLDFCEKHGIQTMLVDDLVTRQDHDLVVECSGSPGGLEIASGMIRPRGTIVMKSTFSGDTAQLVDTAESSYTPDMAHDHERYQSTTKRFHRPGMNLSPLVVNEVTVVGSRCGPFSEAIKLLAAKRVDVRGLITKSFPISQAVAALEAAGDRRHIKVLIDPVR